MAEKRKHNRSFTRVLRTRPIDPLKVLSTRAAQDPQMRRQPSLPKLRFQDLPIVDDEEYPERAG